MAQMLDISTDNCPELKSLMSYHGKTLNKLIKWNNKQHALAATSIATTLASKFPNIKCIFISIGHSHDIMICFLSALVDCFADKLVGFDYEGPLHFTNKLPMTNLQTVNLKLTKGYEGNSSFTICPQSVKELTILTIANPFDWKLFNTEHNSNGIVFDKLEYLKCMGCHPNGLNDDTNITRNLHFPSIKKTAVFNFALGTNEIERQLHSGLRELIYTDLPENALELSQLDLSSLVNLTLVLLSQNISEYEEAFVGSTNTLFSRLKGIPTVEASFLGDISILDPTVVNWPNLTRLVLKEDKMNGNIFELVLSMPDLVYLEVNNCDIDARIINTAVTYFQNLRSDHTKPSGSNIITLKIEGIKQDYYDQLSSSIQALKWFWPKLMTIDICL